MGDESKYDCLTCPYPRYRDELRLFCDCCIYRLLEEHKTIMEVTYVEGRTNDRKFHRPA